MFALLAGRPSISGILAASIATIPGLRTIADYVAARTLT